MLAQASNEVITAAKVLDKCDAGLAMLEPTLDYFLNYFQHSKLLVGRSLVKMAGPIPISRRLLNPTSDKRRVYKNILAALCELVDGDQVGGEPWLRQTETDI